jgi:hypothetical protein
VNGTAVLGEMFREAGCKVTSRRFLSPRINDYDTIVWAPDDFQPPGDDVRDFLEDWLAQGPQADAGLHRPGLRCRGVVLGSDPRCGPGRPAGGSPASFGPGSGGLRSAPCDHAGQPGLSWFTMHRDPGSRPAGKAATPRRWSGTWSQDDSLEVSGIRAEIHSRLEPPAPRAAAVNRSPYRSEILLQSPDGILAYRLSHRTQPGSQIVVVNNGSFLLNLPLIEKEHRKLAGKLIAQCGTPAKVVFLESGEGGPFVFQAGTGQQAAHGIGGVHRLAVGRHSVAFPGAGRAVPVRSTGHLRSPARAAARSQSPTSAATSTPSANCWPAPRIKPTPASNWPSSTTERNAMPTQPRQSRVHTEPIDETMARTQRTGERRGSGRGCRLRFTTVSSGGQSFKFHFSANGVGSQKGGGFAEK